MNLILSSSDSIEGFKRFGGGKARNLARLKQLGVMVPDWFCISSVAFQDFLAHNKLALSVPSDRKNLAAFAGELEERFVAHPLPPALEKQILEKMTQMGFQEKFVAVRSSGLDEDSAANSFAGQFSSFMYQKGLAAVAHSLKLCWASGFSERALSYRIERGLALSGIQIGVVVQLMVDAEAAGVAFSRNPVRPLDRENLVVSSVWGLGEGLVSGELDADNFEVHREKLTILSTIVDKSHALRQAPKGGLVKVAVPAENQKRPSLTDEQVRSVARLAIDLEKRLGCAQDLEWAYCNNQLYCLQTRPVTSLPNDAFYDPHCNGVFPTLWDNSNIIESYSGVTSPLTFTFASNAYRQVYIQFCEVMGVADSVIVAHEGMFRNMLGLLRGRIYYNLINWYRLVLMLPGTSSNKGFMETMMGVKQNLSPDVSALFDNLKPPVDYSLAKRMTVFAKTVYRFNRMDRIIGDFNRVFLAAYDKARKTDFSKLSITEQSAYYQMLDEQILRQWKAPIINDYLCMIFFGLLKKLTENWVQSGNEGASLQNDLLCGQGDLESTEPTKMLMRIAEKIDKGEAGLRSWFITAKTEQLLGGLQSEGKAPEIQKLFLEFLDRYGFRCINELKLEESDLHDDPSFVLQAVASYVKMKSYSIHAMEEREIAIRTKAEKLVREKLGGWKRPLYFWVLKQARRAVRNRENLRFARTKIFGVVRHIFRAMGQNFVKLGVLADSRDIFYLTVDEIFSYIEGRSVTGDLGAMALARKAEFAKYRDTAPPPDRLLTRGAAGVSERFPMVLADADLLRSTAVESDDPNLLLGTPCCPGIIEGVVRVVKDIKDAEGIAGEILVTERTDPGWVPLYPSCSGLLIERGSLLSHSAVVARELGLPTIVGISGGLMKKLKTGQRVRVDAGKGEVRILS